MLTESYILSFLLIYTFFALYLRSVLKNKNSRIWIVLSAICAIVFIGLVYADSFEIAKNAELTKVYYQNLDNNSKAPKEDLCEYQKNVIEIEKKIVQGYNWNRDESDVFKSNNIKIASDILKKVLYDKIFKNLPVVDYEDGESLKIFDDPKKNMGESFVVLGTCIESYIMKDGALKNSILGENKNYSLIVTYCHVKSEGNGEINTVHIAPIPSNEKHQPVLNKKFVGIGICIGTLNYKGKDVLAFLN